MKEEDVSRKSKTENAGTRMPGESIDTLNGKTETLNGRLKIAEMKFKNLTKKPYKK